jgi:L-seryl-tRNA(Ser) seleniumtransferase
MRGSAESSVPHRASRASTREARVETDTVNSALRTLPAVHRLLAEPDLAAYVTTLGPGAVKSAVSGVLADIRRHAAEGESGAAEPPSYAALVLRIADRLARDEAGGMLEVLNGTGILLHTNLGRAPLAAEAAAAAAAISAGYSNIEFDLEAGARGSRYDRVTPLLRETTGAQDGILVNNCAAAVLLILDTFAKGREVIVARNELIEIGGGFRLPDVLARSGAKLVEVGTTNKVYARDFERALSVDTALFLRSHPSNFRITGFVAGVAPRELTELGRRAGVPTVEDLGTGALVDLTPYGIPHERTVPEAIADGVDLVAFSSDKLLGGPQAGVIVGNAAAVARLRANPLLRALRVDKATLAAFAATLRLYVMPGGRERIPLYAMLALSIDALRERAQRLCAQLGAVARCTTVTETIGYVGGGTLPQTQLASAGLRIVPPAGHPDDLATRLRRSRPAIVGRVSDGAFILDLRTIPASCDAQLAGALAHALGA